MSGTSFFIMHLPSPPGPRGWRPILPDRYSSALARGCFFKSAVLAKSIPRCHFPIMQVRYPCFLSMLATVVRPASRMGAEYPPITSDFSTERQLYLPVRKPYREGVHTAAVECASVNRIPLWHILSRFGVVKGHFSLKAEMSPYPISSASM